MGHESKGIGNSSSSRMLDNELQVLLLIPQDLRLGGKLHHDKRIGACTTYTHVAS